MRFITEFELQEAEIDYKGTSIRSNRRTRHEQELGEGIAKAFGWEEKGHTTLHGPVKERHTIEIEAFPMDKWIEFEKRFYDALPDYDVVSKTRLINALTALMTFQGKPSGDTITNQQLNK